MIITGDRVIIKLTEKSDLHDVQGIWNNGEVMKWVGFPEGLNISLERLEKWHNHISSNKFTNHFLVFSADGMLSGELFYEIDSEHRRAGLDIKLLPEAQGKGLATEGLKLLIDYIFANEEKVDAVWTEPSATNLSARKLYTKCGLSEKPRPADMEPAESYWELTREDWLGNKNRG